MLGNGSFILMSLVLRSDSVLGSDSVTTVKLELHNTQGPKIVQFNAEFNNSNTSASLKKLNQEKKNERIWTEQNMLQFYRYEKNKLIYF